MTENRQQLTPTHRSGVAAVPGRAAFAAGAHRNVSGTAASTTATPSLPPEGPVPDAASQSAITRPAPGSSPMVPARPAVALSPTAAGRRSASSTSARKRGPRQVSMTPNPENDVPLPAWIS